MATTISRRRDGTTSPSDAAGPFLVVTRSSAGVWWRTYLHHLRLLRNGAVAWIAGLAGMGWGIAATFDMRHGSPEELAALRDMVDIPAFEAMMGRYVRPDTVEGLVLSRWGWLAILAVVWGMLAAAKLFRGAEETGHLEPLRAGVISARGLLLSGLAALFTTHLIFAVAIAVGHSAGGMDAATSWATGGAMALLTAIFATGVALTSQLVATRRRAVGIVGIALGVTLGVRVVAAASATPDWMWWATPFGWIGFLHEIDQARGQVLVSLSLLLAVLLVAALSTARRDLHTGLLDSGEEATGRVGRPLRSQTALAVRLTVAPTRTWGLILGALTLVFGLLARDFADAIAAVPTTVAMIEAQLGWVGLDTAGGIVAWSFLLGVLLLAVFAAGQVAAIREEEATWRIEHLLARPVGRLRWLATRMGASAVAIVVIALGAGVAAWLGTTLVGSPITLTDGLLAGVNIIPLALLTLGVGIGVFGLAPRLTAPVTYGLVIVTYLLDFVGGLLDLPEWMLDLSPFRYLTAVPAADMNVAAALVMLAIGIVGAGTGMLAFHRRDLQEA
jgi:ABC-2 type transport system permease protein